MTIAREKRCLMFLFVASAWWLLRLVVLGFELHGYGVWGQSDIASLRELVMDPLFLRNLALLSGILILAPCPLSHRKTGDMVHCVFHLSGVVSFFLYRDVLEFKEDLIVRGCCVSFLQFLSATLRWCASST